MSNKYTAVTVFDADDPSAASKPITSDSLAFQDFSNTSIPADASSLRPSPPHAQGKIGSSVFDGDQDLGRRVGGSGASNGWLSLEGYTPYFDVETNMVLERCWKTMWPKESYLDAVLGGQPDLYGPFWLPTTLIFTLFFSSSLSGALTAYLNSESATYDFGKLSLALTLVYVYAFAVPSLLWAVMRYWASIDGRSIPELVNLYGYGLTVYVPVSLLAIIPVEMFRLVMGGLAFTVSLSFLLRNLYPILASAPSKAARILALGIAILHIVFASVIWASFLSVGGGIPNVVDGGTTEGVVGNVTTPPIRF